MTRERHFFEDCIRVGEELWFSASKENALCRKNLLTGKLDVVYQFEEPCYTIFLHSRVFFERGILYFVPANANALAAYEIAEGQCRYIDIPRLRVYGIKSDAPYYHFESAVQIGPQIYMFSLLSPEIVVFDMDTEALETIYIRELDFQNETYHHTFGKDVVVWDKKLYLTVFHTAAILELDTQSHTYRILEYPVSTAKFCCIAQDEDVFYITDNSNAGIIRYQAKKRQFDVLCRSFAEPETGGTFFKSIFWNRKLYLFQNNSDQFYIYEIGTGQCTAIKAGVCPPEEAYLFCETRLENKYYAFRLTEHEIFFYYAPTDTMYRLDAAGKLWDIPFFDRQDKQLLLRQRLQKDLDSDIYRENLSGDLELFLDSIFGSGKSFDLERQTTVGENIHIEMMKGK